MQQTTHESVVTSPSAGRPATPSPTPEPAAASEPPGLENSLLYRLGFRSATHPWRVVGAWLLLAVIVVAGVSLWGNAYNDTLSVPGVDSSRAVELLDRAGSQQAGVTTRVVATPVSQATTFAQGAAADELGTLERSLTSLKNVEAATVTISPDESVAIVDLQYRTLDHLSRDDLDRLNETLDEFRSASATSGTPLQIEAGGELYWTYSEASSSASELIGVALAILILLLAFGSLLAMGLPMVTALFGIAVGVSLVAIVSHFASTPSTAPQMGVMIGLGVGIDYALFLVTRFREYPHATRAEVHDAVGRTVATSGKAVLFAGGTVVIAILGLSITGISFITAMAIATSLIVGVMVAASLTLLPALLGLVGRRIDRFSIHRGGSRRHGAPATPRWHRWGAHVTQHAWLYAIVTTVGLLAMTAPVLDLQLGFPDDGVLAESRTERRAYDLVAEAFGPGVNGPLLIAVDLAPTDTRKTGIEAVTAVSRIESALAADPGVAAVVPAQINEANDIATLIAIPTTSPRDHQTNETIARLRQQVLPAVTADAETEVFIGGPTATFDDIAARAGQRLPWFIAAVIAMSFILLTIAFRSIVVPLKAAVLNLLSIGAAYGVIVMVFQWGWGKSLIGLETTIPIMSFIPMFMFAVLFGLSMDYEVFLLSRVREFYDATGDNEQSVIDAIAVTARLITSAALIMISVFGGFVFGSDPSVKMLGLGMATAIFVDATVVRLVLVPATMKLMGDANWWLPTWLDRRLPQLHLD